MGFHMPSVRGIVFGEFEVSSFGRRDAYLQMRIPFFQMALGEFCNFDRRSHACHSRSLPKAALDKVPHGDNWQPMPDPTLRYPNYEQHSIPTDSSADNVVQWGL